MESFHELEFPHGDQEPPITKLCQSRIVAINQHDK